jgi:glycosyltransferase involved in cell wall biosynthesis
MIEPSDRPVPLEKVLQREVAKEPGVRRILLAVSPVSPWPASDGMALRVSRLLEELCSKWDIVLVCPDGGQRGATRSVALRAEINFERVAKWMYLPSQYDIAPIIKTVADAVETHRPNVALLWGGMEYLRDGIPGMPPSLCDRVDCMTLSAWRLLAHSSGNSLRRRLGHFGYVARYEFRMRHASRATVVVGDADAQVLSKILRVQNVKVVPNGVDVPTPLSVERSTRPTVTFTGVMNYQPNVDAVMYFANKIWPGVISRLPKAVFQIVGRSPAPEVLAFAERRGIEIHADVESVQTFLARAWLAVAPMTTGSGIKNKILEAWSVGTPAVMTPIATNGLKSAPKGLLLAAEGAELTEMVVSLLADGERRQALGALALRTAQDTFSWRGQAAAIDTLLADIASRAGDTSMFS